jgi:hypothetical protein
MADEKNLSILDQSFQFVALSQIKYQKIKYYNKKQHLAYLELLKYRFLITSGLSFA